VDQVDAAGVAERIAVERAETVRLVEALRTDLAGIIESVAHSNNDDEHDPDGATSGYERAKATAMLRRAEARLVEFERAEARLLEGTYGRCEECDGEIGRERLDALIATTRCRSCAGGQRRS
jgi:RNA polymerase-binding transcription factor DksA